MQDRIEADRATVQDVVKLGEDICKALTVLHRAGIAHQDIRPGSISIDGGGYKLEDPGVPRPLEHTAGSMPAGDAFDYMAPEVAQGGCGDYRSDIYSLGLVLYGMLNKDRGPFLPLPPESAGHDRDRIARERRLEGAPLPPPADADEELSRIVLKACAYRPEDRWKSAEEMGQALAGYQLAAEQPQTAAPSGAGEGAADCGEQLQIMEDELPIEEVRPEVTDTKREGPSRAILPEAPSQAAGPGGGDAATQGDGLSEELRQMEEPISIQKAGNDEEKEPPAQVEALAAEEPSAGGNRPAYEPSGGDSPAVRPRRGGKTRLFVAAAAAVVLGALLAGGVGPATLADRPPDPSAASSSQPEPSAPNAPLPTEDGPHEPIQWQDILIRDGVLAALGTDGEGLTPELLEGLEELRLPVPEPGSGQADPVSTLADLSMLTGLKVLDLSGHPVEVLDFPADMPHLETLKLAGCGCADLKFLEQDSLQGLRELDLGGNEIADLTPIAGLTRLVSLNISKNPVGSLAPLGGLSKLAVLWAVDIQVEDWSYVDGVAHVEGKPEDAPGPVETEGPSPTPTPTARPHRPSTPTPAITDPPGPSVIAVTSVTISHPAKLMEVGRTFQLRVTISPTNATDQTVFWSSLDPSIATVSPSGSVEAVGRGTTRITATCGGKSDVCVVTVD